MKVEVNSIEELIIICFDWESAGDSSLAHFFLESVVEGEGAEVVAAAFVELVLEFNPVESEGMQEALHGVHAHQDEEGNREKGKEQQEHSNSIHSDFHFCCECLLLKGLLEEDTGKLGMGKRKSPKTKVRGRVGDCT